MLSSLPSLHSIVLFAAVFMALRTAAIFYTLYRQRCSALHSSTVRLRRRSVRGSDADRMQIASSLLSSSSAASSSSVAPLRTLAILGSGGHTAELLTVMDHLPRSRYCPLLYVRAATDAGSESKARRREEQRGNQNNASHVAMPRSREVGQSYVSSVWTTLVALAHAVAIVWRYKPELVSGRTNDAGLLSASAMVKDGSAELTLLDCRAVLVLRFCATDRARAFQSASWRSCSR